MREMSVGADFTWDVSGNRVTSIRLTVSFPDGLSQEKREAVLHSILSCPARKMLSEPPTVECEFKAEGVRPLVEAALDRGSWPHEHCHP
jgi:uncharacterized OsmC-like protein